VSKFKTNLNCVWSIEIWVPSLGILSLIVEKDPFILFIQTDRQTDRRTDTHGYIDSAVNAN